MRSETVRRLARECGFELAGIASADAPVPDFDRYEAWVSRGHAGEMRYLTDRRAKVRRDIRNLLPSARSVICVGKLYNTRPAQDAEDQRSRRDATDPIISGYAQGRDYHHVLREGLDRLTQKLLALESFEWKICVDTAPLLERSLARQAGLGWIGRNTCLINEPMGSWFFLGELIVSLAIEPDTPPPDRCGTCTRCIEACPTNALVREPRSGDAYHTSELHSGDAYQTSESHSGDAHEPSDDTNTDNWTLDARRCISYLTIELHGSIPEEHRAAMGPHIFGCDICQDVCPWNSRAPISSTEDFLSTTPLPDALQLAFLSEGDFREMFKDSPIARPKHRGFLRNLVVAMGNSGDPRHREPLEHLSRSEDQMVSEHARWALRELTKAYGVGPTSDSSMPVG